MTAAALPVAAALPLEPLALAGASGVAAAASELPKAAIAGVTPVGSIGAAVAHAIEHHLQVWGSPMPADDILRSFKKGEALLHKQIEATTGISTRSLERYMTLAERLEDRLEEGPRKGLNALASDAEDLIAFEAINRQHPEMIKAARYATQRYLQEQEAYLAALPDTPMNRGYKANHIAANLAGLLHHLPQCCENDGTPVSALIAKSWERFDHSFALWQEKGASNQDKLNMIQHTHLKSFAPHSPSRAFLIHYGLCDLIPDPKRANLNNGFRIECPDGTLGSLTVAPYPPMPKEELDAAIKSHREASKPIKARMMRDLKLSGDRLARQYLIAHPIDLNALDNTEVLDFKRNLGIDNGYNIRESITHAYPEYFTGFEGEISPEQRSKLASNLTHGIQLLGRATTLAQAIVQLEKYRKQAGSTSGENEVTHSAAANDAVDQLLLDHIRNVAPEGTVIINPDGSFVVQDETLRAEVAREKATLANPAAPATNTTDHGMPLDFGAPLEVGAPLTRVGEREPVALGRAAPPPPPDVKRPFPGS